MPGMVFVVNVPSAEHEKRLVRGAEDLITLDHQGPKARARPQELFPMEKILDELLRKLNVENVVWCKDKLGHFYQVTFSVGAGDPCENCLHCLTEMGIGKKWNSVVSVVPCSVFYNGRNDGTSDVNPEEQNDIVQKKKWNNFVQSIRSKLTVKQVVDGVRSGGECSFDYLLLVLTADMIAAVGLVESNAVNIVAAMLVSPLMGPIMAFTFGTIISDRKLVKIGIRSEIIGLSISILFGFIFGLLVGCTQSPWGYGDWPTDEMKARGNYRSLWIGVLWALPSGTGVALALLQGSAGPLIGVAISASLLPPAVNCGIMWALACVQIGNPYYIVRYLKGEDYTAPNFTSQYNAIYYTDDIPRDLATMGIISFCLTLVNIACIFITAILVLKIKEVAAPYTSSPDLRRFWQQDIRMARCTNRSTVRRHRTDSDNQLVSELNDISPENLGTTLEAAVRQALADPTFRKVKRVSYSHNSSDVLRALGLGSGERRPSSGVSPETPLNDPATLEHLILTLTGEKKTAQKLTRAHTLTRSMRRTPSTRSHMGSMRNSLILTHNAHSSPSNHSPATSINLGLPTIMESGNSKADNKRTSVIRNLMQNNQSNTNENNVEETTSLTLNSE